MAKKLAIHYLVEGKVEKELRKKFPEELTKSARIERLCEQSELSRGTILRVLDGKPITETTMKGLQKVFPKIRRWVDFTGDTSAIKRYLQNELDAIETWFKRTDQPPKENLVTPTITSQDGIIRYKDGLHRSLTQDSDKVLIVAGSGMGKSVFLKTYFQSLANRVLEHKPRQEMPPIPILLDESRLAAPKKAYGNVPNSDLVLKIIYEVINSIAPNKSNSEDLNEIAPLTDKFVVLIDALDQLSENVLSYFFSSNINQAVFQPVQVIATTREDTVSVNPNRFLQYQRLEIKPFTARQVNKYLSTLTQLSSDKKREILETLFHLAQTPLLMYMIGELYQHGSRASPQGNNVYSLYSMFFHNILKRERIRQEENVYAPEDRYPLPIKEIQILLEEISFYSVQRQCDQTIFGENLRQLKNHLESWAIETKRSTLEDLDPIETACAFGVIHKIIEERFDLQTIRFKHRSFQEFLAAESLGRRIRRKHTTISEFLKSSGTPGNRQLVFFYALSPDAENLDAISEWLWAQYSESGEIPQLFDLARVLRVHRNDFECPQLKEKVRLELLSYVNAHSKVVLPSDAPFAALADLGDFASLARYSAELEKNNAVNRFYSFKHTFSGLTDGDERSEQVFNEINNYIDSTKAPGSKSKVEFLFAATKIRSSDIDRHLFDVIVSAVQELPYGLGKVALMFNQVTGRKFDDRLVTGWIPELKKHNLRYPFFAPASKELYYEVKNLSRIKRGILNTFAKKLTGIVRATDGKPWQRQEDIWVELLGYFLQGNALLDMAEVYPKEELPQIEIDYKLSRVAHALSACYPFAFTDEKKHSEQAANLILGWFKAGHDNLFRHHLALSLAALGTPKVEDFFMEFIKDPDEKQRWLGTMVLGALDSATVEDGLESVIVSTVDDRTRFFASQALLLHSQTFDLG